MPVAGRHFDGRLHHGICTLPRTCSPVFVVERISPRFGGQTNYLRLTDILKAPCDSPIEESAGTARPT